LHLTAWRRLQRSCKPGFDNRRCAALTSVDGGEPPPSTAAPTQFPLKSLRVTCVETARWIFLLRGMIFPCAKNPERPPHMPPGAIEAARAASPPGSQGGFLTVCRFRHRAGSEFFARAMLKKRMRIGPPCLLGGTVCGLCGDARRLALRQIVRHKLPAVLL
jgi:hypothetical protein